MEQIGIERKSGNVVGHDAFPLSVCTAGGVCMNEFTTLTFNLTNSPIRREVLQGRNYIVAPTAMLTEGVHAGSRGPLLYREAECKKAIPAWNMKPIVVYHPGTPISACDPIILEKQQVGMCLNTRWKGKLRTEAWIDEERAKVVDARVIDALEQNKPMEVSTGLFTDNGGGPGTWNGEEYAAEAVNHQPDHLALLPDKIGACSIADGAGMLCLNEAAEAEGLDMTHVLETFRRVVGNAIGEKSKPPVDEKLDAKGKAKARAEWKKANPFKKDSEMPETLMNERSGKKMDKKTFIDALIASKQTTWNEEDRSVLEQIEDDTLAKMAPVEPDPATPPPIIPPIAPVPDAPATPPEPVTLQAYMDAAPPELRGVLTNALVTHNQAKDALINTITANKANQFSKEFLATKEIPELQGLAALAGVPVANDRPVPMFNGAFTPTGPVMNSGAEESPLLPPVMNFGTEK